MQIGNVFQLSRIVEAYHFMEENIAGGKIMVLTTASQCEMSSKLRSSIVELTGRDVFEKLHLDGNSGGSP